MGLANQSGIQAVSHRNLSNPNVGIAYWSGQLPGYKLINRAQPNAFGIHQTKRLLGIRFTPMTASIDNNGDLLVPGQESQRDRLNRTLGTQAKNNVVSCGKIADEPIGFGVLKKIGGAFSEDDLLVLSKQINGHHQCVVALHLDVTSKQRELHLLLANRSIDTMRGKSSKADLAVAMAIDG